LSADAAACTERKPPNTLLVAVTDCSVSLSIAILQIACYKSRRQIMGLKTISRRAPHRWADKTSAIDRDGDTIWIFGDRFKKPPPDAMTSYETQVDGPHVVFANCKSEAQLLKFTADFGPVVVREAVAMYSPIADGDLVEAYGATASLNLLRRERQTFRALLEIAGMIQENYAPPNEAEAVDQGNHSRPQKRKTSEKVLEEIKEREGEMLNTWTRLVKPSTAVVEGTSHWNDQYLSEAKSRRKSESGVPVWLWSDREQLGLESQVREIETSIRHAVSGQFFLSPGPFHAARKMIGIIVNAFPDRFTWYEDRAAYVAPTDFSFGIRPLLFAMMRRDLAAGRHFRVCAAKDCDTIFAANRKDKRCHSLECSLKFNAHQYHERGRRPRPSNDRKPSVSSKK
jgi:hypothetical protein